MTKRCTSAEKGAVTLTTTLLIVMIIMLCVLHAHRALWLEQRIAAQQARAVDALALAESGAAWALARLNDTSKIRPGPDGLCDPSSATEAQAFRAWYAPTTTASDGITQGHASIAGARAACTMADGGALQCACPAPGSAPASTPAAARAFTVGFSTVPGDASVLRLTVVACVHTTRPCTLNPVDGRPSSDATARVTHLVKRLPILAALPRAAVTAGGQAQACGATQWVNTSTATQGALAHTGGAAQTSACTAAAALGASVAVHISSQPNTSQAVAAQDIGLRQAAEDPLRWWRAWLVHQAPQHLPGVCVIDGRDAAERGQRLVTAHQRLHHPCTHFWVRGDATISDVVGLGQSQSPVLIMAEGMVRLQGGARVHGLVLSAADAHQPVADGAQIWGGLVARGDVLAGQRGVVTHDAATLAALAATGPYVVVPGSWMDE